MQTKEPEEKKETSTQPEEKKPEPKPKLFGKKKFSATLDTDAINEQFTFGGEKGMMLAQENEEEKIEAIVFPLAKECADYMRNILFTHFPNFNRRTYIRKEGLL